MKDRRPTLFYLPSPQPIGTEGSGTRLLALTAIKTQRDLLSPRDRLKRKNKSMIASRTSFSHRCGPIPPFFSARSLGLMDVAVAPLYKSKEHSNAPIPCPRPSLNTSDAQPHRPLRNDPIPSTSLLAPTALHRKTPTFPARLRQVPRHSSVPPYPCRR